MIATNKKTILYIGTVVGVGTYLFWNDLKHLGFNLTYKDKNVFSVESIKVFYLGNALFIFSLCLYMFLTDTKSLIKYVIFCLSLNNLCDELFFDPTKMGISEIFVAITVLVFAIIRYKNAKRP